MLFSHFSGTFDHFSENPSKYGVKKVIKFASFMTVISRKAVTLRIHYSGALIMTKTVVNVQLFVTFRVVNVHLSDHF